MGARVNLTHGCGAGAGDGRGEELADTFTRSWGSQTNEGQWDGTGDIRARHRC